MAYGKTRNEHDDGLRIGGVHLLHQFFLVELERFPIAPFSSHAGIGTRFCGRIRVEGLEGIGHTAHGIVANDDHSYVGRLGGIDGRVALVVLGVIHGER